MELEYKAGLQFQKEGIKTHTHTSPHLDLQGQKYETENPGKDFQICKKIYPNFSISEIPL